MVKNSLPGDPPVDRFPKIAGAGRHVPGTRIGGAHRDVRNPSAHDCRANTPQLEPIDGFSNRRVILGLGVDVGCRKKEGGDQYD